MVSGAWLAGFTDEGGCGGRVGDEEGGLLKPSEASLLEGCLAARASKVRGAAAGENVVVGVGVIDAGAVVVAGLRAAISYGKIEESHKLRLGGEGVGCGDGEDGGRKGGGGCTGEGSGRVGDDETGRESWREGVGDLGWGDGVDRGEEGVGREGRLLKGGGEGVVGWECWGTKE